MSTKTIHHSYGSRLGDSFKGILGGLAAIVAGVWLLFWNEGRTVKRAQSLEEGEKVCEEVADIQAPDPAQEGRLVHFTGPARTEETLEDAEFGVSVNGLRLERAVEMYQWVEHERRSEKKNLGGSTDEVITYTYSKEWHDSPIDSKQFDEAGHDNPEIMEFRDGEWLAQSATVGAFRLPEEIVRRIGGARAFPFGPDFALPDALKDRAIVQGGYIYLPVDASSVTNRYTQPSVGDLRVSFRWVPNHDISVIARQMGDTLGSYTTKTKTDGLLEIRDGAVSAEEMFRLAKEDNKTFAWILRLVGTLILFLGCSAVLKPISTLLDVLPFLGNIAGAATGIVAAAVALPVALVTIAIAWLWYRPVLGIALLAAAVALFVFLKRKANRPAAES